MRRIQNFLASHRLIQVVITVLCLLALLFTHYRMKAAETELAEYWQAKSCPNQDNCREKIEAMILDSYGLTVFVKGFSTKYGNLPSSGNTHYGVVLSSGIGTTEIEINADPPTNGTPFDIPNVYVPTGRDSLFVSTNLYKNQTVYIEVWKNKITILYLDKIVDVPDPIVILTPDPNAQPVIINNQSPKTYEIALPSTIHPIFLQASTERDFFSTGLICFLLLLFLYGGELIRIPEEVTKKKRRKGSN